MNPERRFGQLEEVMAEMLQKQDRLEVLAIKTFEIAENANAKVDKLDIKLTSRIDTLDTKAEITARGLASLTLENKEAHKEINDKIDQVNGKLESMQTEVNSKLESMQTEVNSKLNLVQTDIADLKSVQQQIMDFLREKLP